MAISLTMVPQSVKLSETRELRISLILKNDSKNAVRLEFPTTQRIEAVIREKMGKIITQWSEDQNFSNETSYLVINPRERLEYSVTLPTRDMVAGRDYSVEVFLPNYENLRARRFITPEK